MREFRIFPRKAEVEVDDELGFHLEQRVRDYIARGMDPESARAAAIARLGDLTTARQECTQMLEDDRRTARRRDWFQDLGQDLRFGIRAALRAPLFTLLAVVTLALGIGANAAVFGVVKSVLLDALPYADADRVIRAYGRRVDGSQDRGPVSAGTITEVAARQRSFSQIAAFEGIAREAVYSGENNPIVTKVAWVEPALFPTLGVPAARGRLFRAEDAAADTAYNVIVTHATWQRLFGGDP